MADDVSPGELYRRQIDHEQRTDRVHAALDGRLTDLAKDTVPMDVWRTAERARDAEVQRMARERHEDLADLKDTIIKPILGRLDKLEKRPSIAWGWVVVGGTLLVGVLGVLIQAWAAAKGAK